MLRWFLLAALNSFRKQKLLSFANALTTRHRNLFAQSVCFLARSKKLSSALKACCESSLFAALADADDVDDDFIKRIKDFIKDYFNGNCNLFATKCCNSLFAAFNSVEKAGKLRKRSIDTLIRVCFGKNKSLFPKACCNSLFAALADEEDGVAFIGRIKDFIKDYFNGNCNLFATKCSRWFICGLTRKQNC